MKLTAEQLYKRLVTDNKLIGQKGKITFKLMDISLEVDTKDTVGNLVQEWIKAWMIKENIEFSVPAKITRSGHQTKIKMYENHFYKADWKELDRLVEAA